MPFIINPDRAARAICDGLQADRTEIVFPLPMAVMTKAARLLPVRLWSAVMQRAVRR